MPLSSGTRLGTFEIVAPLGEGGMGQVYRARDTKLQRDVALKILPDAFASDRDRLARFEREAQVLASLNHPNIAHIHGVEESGSVRALVMELVDGDDLSVPIARGPMPIDEVLPIARQILDGLEAAHDQGIVHRDLKPANIKLRPDGTVKVLDFGLAKAIEGAGGTGAAGGQLSQSPTITTPAMTQAGVVLGTAAYMSPEQAKGRPADRRSDLWAFGCIVYEMMTAQRPFAGEDVADTLAHILTKEPDWTALPTNTPTAIRRLLRRCLERDRKRRIDSAAAARLDIDEAASGETATVPTLPPSINGPAPRSSWLAWSIAAAAIAAAIVAFAKWAPWRATPEPARLAFELGLAGPGNASGSPTQFAISPDGTQVVSRVFEDNVPRLAVRSLARLEATTLAHTENGAYPFWSPDGRTIVFFADGKLKSLDVAGGTPQTMLDAAGYGGSWNRDGVILFVPRQNGGISKMPATGGPALPVTELNVARGDIGHRFPRFLPDGRHFVFLVKSSKPESGGIYLGSLDATDTHRLVDTDSKPEFAGPDLLLFARGGALMAQRLDVAASRLTGSPFQIVEPVGSSAANGSASFSVSSNGVLAYRNGFGGDAQELVWLDRSGKRLGAVGAPAGYRNPQLSPDGKQLAVYKPDGGGDIWITELERGTSTRFTTDPASDNMPVWSPDGSRIAFVSDRDGGIFNIYQKNVNGTGADDLLLKTPYNKIVTDWSRDGRTLIYQEENPKTKNDLWTLSLTGDRKPMPLLASPFNEVEGTLSPNGRWIAYMSDEGGNRQVYVAKFPAMDRKWLVSTTRITAHPRWSADGHELFFDASGTMSAVSITEEGPLKDLKLDVPKALFAGLQDFPPHNFDVAGDRFLVLMNPGAINAAGNVPPITIIVNWQSGLPTRR
jgi:serine/threonine protein kinase/Tol biopolymer transport system component